MDYFSEVYGLVTDNDPKSENGQLFLAEYILLAQTRKYDRLFATQLNNSNVEIGLYHRNPILTKRCLSHDNMTGIMAWSYFSKTYHRFEIWKYLLKHGFTYDDSKGKSTQISRLLPFNPSNILPWGLCADSKLVYVLLPILAVIYAVSLFITCNRPATDTSGKILSWVELTALQDKIVMKPFKKYFDYKMKKQYGENYIKELMRIYHGGNSKEFPINKLLGLGV